MEKVYGFSVAFQSKKYLVEKNFQQKLTPQYFSPLNTWGGSTFLWFSFFVAFARMKSLCSWWSHTSIFCTKRFSLNWRIENWPPCQELICRKAQLQCQDFSGSSWFCAVSSQSGGKKTWEIYFKLSLKVFSDNLIIQESRLITSVIPCATMIERLWIRHIGEIKYMPYKCMNITFGIWPYEYVWIQHLYFVFVFVQACLLQ